MQKNRLTHSKLEKVTFFHYPSNMFFLNRTENKKDFLLFLSFSVLFNFSSDLSLTLPICHPWLYGFFYWPEVQVTFDLLRIVVDSILVWCILPRNIFFTLKFLLQIWIDSSLVSSYWYKAWHASGKCSVYCYIEGKKDHLKVWCVLIWIKMYS